LGSLLKTAGSSRLRSQKKTFSLVFPKAKKKNRKEGNLSVKKAPGKSESMEQKIFFSRAEK